MGLYDDLAEQGSKGDVADGLAAVRQALAIVEETSERWWESETHRIKAKLLAAADTGGQRETEKSYLQGLDIAREQGAHLLALRSAVSIARMWRDQGKTTAAHDLLAPLYGRFTEGSDNADLKDAKVLLDELK